MARSIPKNLQILPHAPLPHSFSTSLHHFHKSWSSSSQPFLTLFKRSPPDLRVRSTPWGHLRLCPAVLPSPGCSSRMSDGHILTFGLPRGRSVPFSGKQHGRSSGVSFHGGFLFSVNQRDSLTALCLDASFKTRLTCLNSTEHGVLRCGRQESHKNIQESGREASVQQQAGRGNPLVFIRHVCVY